MRSKIAGFVELALGIVEEKIKAGDTVSTSLEKDEIEFKII